MKTRFTQLLSLLLVLLAVLGGQGAMAQTGVLNPNDPVVIYNPSAPPAYPAANTLVKWVKTTRFSWSSDDFKCYFYNNVQFRLKWPKTFATDPVGTKYPLYMFFHGVGEGGTIYDNEFQFSHGGQIHQQAVNNGQFDGFLLYPQSASSSGGWSQAQVDGMYNLILNYLIPQEQVDPDRIIVSGLSGGGDASWMFLESHPTMPAAGFIMSSANISDIQYAGTLKYTPIWLFQGGLDGSPDPSTTIQLVNAYNNDGGNLTYTVFPQDGHDTWDDAWNQPGYFPWLSTVNKSKPWTLTGKNSFCPGTTVGGTMGVVAGMSSYQWRLNGTPISGATSNSYAFTALGKYDVTFVNNGYTSPYLGIDTISTQAPTISPNISVNGLVSDVLPAPDGSTSVSLTVPGGYTSYVWERVDSPVGNPAILSSTTNVLNGATPGQYAVKVTQQFGCSSSFSTPFTVIKAGGPNAPSVPTTLIATATSTSSIRLNWNEPANQLETQFEVYQGSASTGPFKLIGFTPALTDSFVINNLNPKTTYYYIVRAINATAASAVAGPSSAMTQSDTQPPTAPSGLTIGSTSQTSVSLFWTAATDNTGVVAYDIYLNGNLAYSIGDTTTFTFSNLVNGQNYDFTVRARDFAGNVSPFSNQVAAVPQFNGLNYSYYTGTWNNLPNFNTLTPVVSGQVPNVTLANALGTVDYAFKWTGYIYIPVTGTYSFQTSSDDGSDLYIDIPYSATATPTVNNDALQGTTTKTSAPMTLTAGVHTFCATYFQQGGGAVMSVQWSTPSSGGFVTIPSSAFTQNLSAPGTPPTAPVNVTATAASAKKINLAWQNTATNFTGTQVFRSTSATGTFATVATLKPARTSYTDSALSPSTTYYYKLQAINNYGSSKFNLQDSSALSYNFYNNYTATTLTGISALTPTSSGPINNFTLGVTTATSNFALQFNGFINILQAGTYTFYTNSDDGSNLFIDGTMVVNNDNPHGPQQVAGNVTLTAGRHAIQVNFFQAGGGQQLIVQYSSSALGIAQANIPDSILSIPPANATTQALPALPAAPSGLTGTALGKSHVSLSWTNNATNATGYMVYRSPITNTNYLLAATLPVTSAYVDSNLTTNTVYFYKVLAFNEGGNSAYSNEISDTTSNTAVTVVTLSGVPAQNIVNDSSDVINLTASSNLGGNVAFASTTLPAFGTLTDNQNGTATLTVKPNSTQLGTFTFYVTATDNFGTVATDTVVVNVKGKNQTTVLVNFNNAGTPVQGAPWNSLSSAPNSGLAVGSFKDSLGNVTTDGISLQTSWDGSYNTGMNTGNNSGVVPDKVMQNFYFGSTFNPYNFKVTGLNSAKKYALVFFAGYPWTSSDVSTYGNLLSTYTIGSTTLTLNVANNTTQTVQINGLSPDASGNISIVVSKPLGSAYCLLSAMKIISYDAATSTAALLPPTNLTAVGVTTNAIQLNWLGSADTRTGYQIYRSTSPVGTFNLLATVAGNAVSYKDSSLPANSTYFYEVREVVSGPAYSNYSNIAGGSTVAYQVDLSLNSQTTVAAPAPWNDINTVFFAGFQLPNLVNTNNQPTGINFNVNTMFTNFNGGLGVTTGNNSGVVPDVVMQTFYYNSSGDTARISFNGLSKTQVYNFGFYAGTNFSSTATVGMYQIGNQVVSLNAFNNTANMSWIYGVTPDTSGTINIVFYCAPGTGYAMLNAIEVQGMPSAAVIGSDSTGTGGVIATSVRNNGTVAGTALGMTAAVDSASNPFNITAGAYPNPFVDNVTVKFDLTQNVSKFTLVIADASGRIVQKQEFSDVPAGPWVQTLNTSSLGTGTYYVKVLGLPAGQAVETFKVVKVKR
jgi:PA14 domain/Secretion system C-terminal sorting domain/Fibronectin type III domain